MVSREQWEAIRQRFLSDYSEFVRDGEPGDLADYSAALEQAMEDIKLLLPAARVYDLLPFVPGDTNTIIISTLTGTCIDCINGVCKKKGLHT